MCVFKCLCVFTCTSACYVCCRWVYNSSVMVCFGVCVCAVCAYCMCLCMSVGVCVCVSALCRHGWDDLLHFICQLLLLGLFILLQCLNDLKHTHRNTHMGTNCEPKDMKHLIGKQWESCKYVHTCYESNKYPTDLQHQQLPLVVLILWWLHLLYILLDIWLKLSFSVIFAG